MRHQIQAVGHVLERRVMHRLHKLVDDSAVDIRDIRITYPSTTACKNMKNPSLLSFCLDGEAEKLQAIKSAVEQVLKDNHCKISMSVEENEEKECALRMYGHILDRKIMDKIAEVTQNLFVDLRNVVIKYPSVFPYYQKQRASECQFLLTGDSESVAKAVRSIEAVARREECLLKIGPDERFKARYLLNITGHILDDMIMDKLAQSVSGLGAEIEDVRIFYPSTNIYRYRGQPSTVEFSVSGHVDTVSRTLDKIRTFADRNDCEINYALHERTLDTGHIEIQGHIIDRDVLNKLAEVIERGKYDVDYANIEVGYDSIHECAHERGPSTLRMDLVGFGADFLEVLKRIRQITVQEGCTILTYRDIEM